MALKILGVALGVLAAVSGCAKLKETTGGALVASLLQPGEKPVPASSIPRAEIEKAGVPMMRVNLVARKADTLIAIRDSKANGVVAWGAGDGSLFTFRNGVLIETRGLGSDLMSSAMPVRADASGARSYFVLGADDQTMRYDFTCTITGRSAETVTVFGRAYGTTHITQSCAGSIGTITNEYWLDSGVIRKSREWVSPAVGYLEFERIVD